MKKLLLVAAMMVMSTSAFASKEVGGDVCNGSGSCVTTNDNSTTNAGGQGGSVNASGWAINGGVQKFTPTNTNTNTNKQAQGQVQGIVGSGNSTIAKGAVSAKGGNATGGSVGNVGNNNGSNDNSYSNSYSNSYKNEVAASSAYAPALTSGNDTCMGSSSVGGSGVGFGFSVGTTWNDENCVRLKNSREMAALGYKNVAVAMMCQDEKVREAAQSIGSNVCGTPAAAPKAVKTSGGPDMTDPFINARLQGK